MLAALACVLVFGYTLNTMSLLGLTLAIGLLIDDSIVMRENIARHIREGQNRMSAARDATNEIGLAVIATTMTILAVFVPVAFISGMAGQWLRPFALTAASAVRSRRSPVLRIWSPARASAAASDRFSSRCGGRTPTG